jgi:hypothetical protein
MENEDIENYRLSNQHITPQSAAKSPEDVLTSFGAIQAQDYPAALWAIGLRCRGSTTKNDVDEAIANRKISRTWLMRGTLHLAASQDLHWMLRLLAPRLTKAAIARDRPLGLNGDAVRKAASNALPNSTRKPSPMVLTSRPAYFGMIGRTRNLYLSNIFRADASSFWVNAVYPWMPVNIIAASRRSPSGI